MTTLRNFITIALLTSFIAACSNSVGSESDPSRVVQDFGFALNGGDLHAAMAFVADDAVFTDTHGYFVSPGDSPMKGKDKISNLLSYGIGVQGQHAMSNFKTQGNQVTWTDLYWTKDPSDPSCFPYPIVSTITVTVEGGKIINLTNDNDTEWYKAYQKCTGAS